MSGLGAYRFPDQWTLDASVNYDRTLTGVAHFFAKLTVLGVLNHIERTTFGTPGSPTGSIDPVSGAWVAGSAWNNYSGASNFMGNRQLQVDLGFRF